MFAGVFNNLASISNKWEILRPLNQIYEPSDNKEKQRKMQHKSIDFDLKKMQFW